MRARNHRHLPYLTALLLLILDQFLVFSAWYRFLPLRFASERWLPLPVTLTNAAVLAGVVYAFLRLPKTYRPSLAFIASGTLSNLLTVAWHGRAVDYMPFFAWMVNVADGAIVVGLVLVFATYYRSWKGER